MNLLKLLILFLVYFLHITNDFYLQGILASMKQKSWWLNQFNGNLFQQDKLKEKYGKDYICALFIHAFSWSFMIHIPFMFFSISYNFIVISIIINMFIHTFVDDLKANKLKINLIQDQFLHLFQITLTFLILTKGGYLIG